MAGILSRFKDIISSNINDLLDKCEDPSKMVDQYLRNAMEDLAEVKKETASVMADEKRCKRLYEENQANIDKYTNLAKKAVQAGNDDDARKFLAEKQKYDANAEALNKAYSIAKEKASQMRQLHDKLTSDVEGLRARRNSVKATMSVAKTQEKINKANESASKVTGALGAFARMEEKAATMLDVAASTAELDSALDDGLKDIESKYGHGGSASVDDELAALKASMGGSSEVDAELDALKAQLDGEER